MTTSNTESSSNPIYWDPYSPEISLNPYAIYKRLRDEAPLYYNEEHDFYVVSRYSDVESCVMDTETFSSARGDILEIIKANMEVPKGMFIWEDPPQHTAYRAVVSRVFTPKRMNALEEKIRDYCAKCLDEVKDANHIDFIADLGEKLPGGVIGMLLGIPDEDRDVVRERVDASLRTQEGKPLEMDQVSYQGEGFEEYIDWRVDNPSDDLMTELLNVEFKDDTGVTRKLTRDEILIFINVIAGAGNETTNRLIGWIGRVLSDYPEQRREIAENPKLISAAIEEILRLEPPSTQLARYVTRDVEIHGQIVPAGSVLIALVGAANRDERRFPEPDRFDVHVQRPPHITFGRGIHACLGAALARVEGRVALSELLKRFPDWIVDLDNARLSPSSTTRGWDAVPAYIGTELPAGTAPAQAEAAPSAESKEVPLEGEWTVTVKGPTGPMPSTLTIELKEGKYSGAQSGDGTTTPVDEIKFDSGKIAWMNQVTKPMKLKLTFSGEVNGDTMTGKVKAGFMGSYPFTGVKVG